MFYKAEFAAPHLVSIAVSLLLLIVAWRLPRLARVFYVALFVWACAVNWYTVVERPQAYLEYAPLAVLDLYRDLIRSSGFAGHIRLFVGTIATCQGLVALGLLAGGAWARIATAGSMVFLIAIAPLGVGSGFPSTLLMAGGALLLLRGDSLTAPLPRSLSQGWRRWRGEIA